MTFEDVDLGVCRGRRFPGEADRTVVVLPGAMYPPSAPLLWFAREVFAAHGWTVVEVHDRRQGGDDPASWVLDRFRAAREFAASESVTVVAKSISSLVAPEAVAEEIPGVWLTPLLGRPVVAEALQQATVPTLVVGSVDDPTWDRAAAARLHRADVLQVTGADHLLQVPGDVPRSLEILTQVADRIDRFVTRLTP